jgi:protein-disulfide isomerase/uncharacterized membrane protein
VKLLRAKSIALTLISMGLVISFYLLWRHFLLLDTGKGQGVDMCLALFGKGCDAVLRNPLSSVWGLPLAGWGLTYFATLTLLLLLAKFLGEAFQFEAHFLALLLAFAALLVGIVLTGVMLMRKVSFCPLCGVVHLINLGLVISLFRLIGKPITELKRGVAAGGKYLWTGQSADPVQARWKLLGVFAVALCAAVIGQRIALIGLPRAQAANFSLNPQEVITAYEAGPALEVPVGLDDPILGPPDSPVQIVLFSDFECPACRFHAGQLRSLQEKNARTLHIVFKHYPLDKGCNPSMKRNLHARACDSAYAAEAARRQGQFWTFHDKLFELGVGTDTNVFRAAARSVGLDVERFEADRSDEGIKSKVRADMELAARLDVHGTPTLFLNKRRVPNIHPQAVKILVEHLVTRKSR